MRLRVSEYRNEGENLSCQHVVARKRSRKKTSVKSVMMCVFVCLFRTRNGDNFIWGKDGWGAAVRRGPSWMIPEALVIICNELTNLYESGECRPCGMIPEQRLNNKTNGNCARESDMDHTAVLITLNCHCDNYRELSRFFFLQSCKINAANRAYSLTMTGVFRI